MIFLQNTEISISDSTFLNGFASRGGSIYSIGDEDYSKLTIYGSTFTNNSVVGYGGAVYSETPTVI